MNSRARHDASHSTSVGGRVGIVAATPRAAPEQQTDKTKVECPHFCFQRAKTRAGSVSDGDPERRLFNSSNTKHAISAPLLVDDILCVPEERCLIIDPARAAMLNPSVSIGRPRRPTPAPDHEPEASATEQTEPPHPVNIPIARPSPAKHRTCTTMASSPEGRR
jgi:hypothetical protein